MRCVCSVPTPCEQSGVFYFLGFVGPAIALTVLWTLGRPKGRNRNLFLVALLGFSAWALDIYFFGPSPQLGLRSGMPVSGADGLRRRLCQ